ncbi:MAG: T9SS type A sorting domain-containing protein, partial [Sinomicrobium sp.]|nr:T9SS type A sorting domain-containing protein [Sinomicrobium sp.]
ENIIIYPNPAADEFYIGLPEGRELLGVALYNIRGEKVAETRSAVLSVAHLAGGVYAAEIRLSGNENIVKKVIISGD